MEEVAGDTPISEVSVKLRYITPAATSEYLIEERGQGYVITPDDGAIGTVENVGDRYVASLTSVHDDEEAAVMHLMNQHVALLDLGWR